MRILTECTGIAMCARNHIHYCMELSLFLAQIWGISLCIMGFSLLVRPRSADVLVQGFAADSFAGYLSGLIVLVIGLAMVLTHNVWDGSWRVIITLFGWLSVAKGVGIILMPQQVNTIARTYMKPMLIRAAAIVLMTLGLALAYFGFWF